MPSSLAWHVTQIKAGMLLFLFEHEETKLYAVFEAASDGAMNIMPVAFLSFGNSFLAQVYELIQLFSLKRINVRQYQRPAIPNEIIEEFERYGENKVRVIGGRGSTKIFSDEYSVDDDIDYQRIWSMDSVLLLCIPENHNPGSFSFTVFSVMSSERVSDWQLINLHDFLCEGHGLYPEGRILLSNCAKSAFVIAVMLNELSMMKEKSSQRVSRLYFI